MFTQRMKVSLITGAIVGVGLSLKMQHLSLEPDYSGKITT